MSKTNKKKQSSGLPRPPVVAVLGHVDHGKTTLLDTLRKTNIAAGEHGNITQHIGAYQMTTPNGETLTFIDTPGHEAFAKMRSRGATVADIAILVVAADDGVMPQTIESINQIKAAGIPFIVAMNKIDLQTANPEKVKKELAKNNVQVEGFGGDIPIVMISAVKQTGIKDLIDMIVLVSEMKGIASDTAAPLTAFVIETKIDKGKGMVASVIVKSGALTINKPLFEGAAQVAKIRAMFDEHGARVQISGPGKPVEVMGFTKLPAVGTVLTDIATTDPIVLEAKTESTNVVMPDFLSPIEDTSQQLNVIIKADTAGSVEAIIQSLDPRIRPVSTGLGAISEADVLLAKSTKAFVIGFNVKLAPGIEKFAYAEKVAVRTYLIIYKLLEELAEVVGGMGVVLSLERELGRGNIIAEFPFDTQRVVGTKIVSGRLARGDSIRIQHDDTEVGIAKIKSMRHAKVEINKAESGVECGVILDKKIDFSVGDVIIAFTK